MNTVRPRSLSRKRSQGARGQGYFVALLLVHRGHVYHLTQGPPDDSNFGPEPRSPAGVEREDSDKGHVCSTFLLRSRFSLSRRRLS